MKISIYRTKVKSVGKRFKQIECQKGGKKLAQVGSFKQLECIFLRDGIILNEMGSTCSKANALSVQL